MCAGLGQIKVETDNARLGIAHSHQHSASEAAHMKELHSNFRDLSMNGGLDAAITAEKFVLNQA